MSNLNNGKVFMFNLAKNGRSLLCWVVEVEVMVLGELGR